MTPNSFDNVTRLTHHLPSPGHHSIQVIHRNSGADMLAGYTVQRPGRMPTDLQSIPIVCGSSQLTGVEAGSELGLAQILVVAQRLSGSTHEIALTIG